MKKLLNNKTIKYMIKNKYLFMIGIVFSILFLGVGYAQITDIELDVNGNATATAGHNVVIYSVDYDSNVNADPDSSVIKSTNLTVMKSHIVLGGSVPSSITYKVRIKNNTDEVAIFNKAVFTSASGRDNNNIDFVVDGLNHGDTLSPGERIECTITFKYIDSLSNVTNNVLNSSVNFKFTVSDKTARIGNVYYDTLQEAINAAPSDTQTIIELLNDTAEVLTVAADKNLEILLRNNTINNVGNTPVFENEGILIMRNGVIDSNATGNGAINNRSTGTLLLDTMNVEVSGGKQALFNEGGIATITGDSYLSSTSNQRGAVQNTSGGTLNVESGTIISTRHNGLVNQATLTVGVSDGNVTNDSPVIIGRYYGITSETYYNFYDGMAKGQTYGLNNTGRATPPPGYEIVGSDENLGGNVYYLNFPSIPVTVSFEPVSMDATVDEPTRKVAVGYKVGILPEAIRPGYRLTGWYTAATGGEKITANTIINEDITFYAHWEYAPDVCEMNGSNYASLQDAITSAPGNTQTTVTLLKDYSEAEITIPTNKNIILDLNGFTLSNGSTKSIIENSGTLIIQNGTVTSDSNTDGAINHNAGTLTISANVIHTGARQAIFARTGTVRIVGSPIMVSSATGTAQNSSLGRSTVQALSGATIIITGGTIINNVQQAISNEGTVTIGTNNGATDPSSPTIRGETFGIVSTGTLNFYDGTAMGISEAIDGTVSGTETTLVSGTTTVSGKTYITKYNS